MERDLYFRTDKEFPQNFNSHAHVERDRKTTEHDTDSRISTHTLTWSVTFRLRYLVPRKDDFNSHAHVERDDKDFDAALKSVISTHTLTWSVT